MGRLTGKRVWITGASGGIGEKMAYLAAEEGAEIIISARRVEKLTSVKEKNYECWRGVSHRSA
ncbi:hypothetical protein BsIDN1_41260 [Bacillus safensis]|uniref:Uncharacterized protein n=1 Tax=Bacillus safensis TaxID=561879 RepID=A0A5S9MC39_BACIA|nr:hypothetical protein BsIDN1_41260 [Bacillus safensis]